jgi:hypothetical protein
MSRYLSTCRVLIGLVVVALGVILYLAILIYHRSNVEEWYLDRPASWWSRQLRVDVDMNENMGMVTTVLGQSPLPSRPSNRRDRIIYRASELSGLKLGTDPSVDSLYSSGPDAIPLLVSLLEDSNVHVRRRADFELSRVVFWSKTGRASTNDVVSELRRAELQSSENVRDRVRELLRSATK